MILDFVILIAVAAGFLQGYRRGLVNSVFFLSAFFLGGIIALRFGYLVALALNRWFGVESEYLPLISLATLFIAILVVVLLIARSLEGVLKKTKLNIFNRIVGGVLWAVTAVYVASLGFWYLEKYHVITPEVTENSVSYPYLGKLSQHMTEGLGHALPFVLDTYYDLDTMLDDFEREHAPARDSTAS